MGIKKVPSYYGKWLWMVTVPLLLLSCSKKNEHTETEIRIAPVRVATIEQRTIEQVRLFSGSLEARAEFVVAPKVGGRIESLEVDVADRVTRGQIVARLDDAEYEQAIASAKADEAVANANLTEASHSLTIAQRELERVETLRERGVHPNPNLIAPMLHSWPQKRNWRLQKHSCYDPRRRSKPPEYVATIRE